MKRRVLLLTFLVSISFSAVKAQSLRNDSLFVPDALRRYQFNLENPVKSIENLRYDKSNEPIRGELSKDGKKVIMDNYKKGQRIKFDATFPDGRVEHFEKSPCFIDPVVYEI
jgi:hypothetical protein